MFFTPLEQFLIIPFITFTNFNYFLLLILLSIFSIKYFNKLLLYKHLEWLTSTINNSRINGENHIYILLTIWLFIILSNVIGLIPYSFTITAQVITVFSIALPTFIAINILGITLHGFNIFYLFLPAGAPIALTPFISILEFISYSVRALSLTLRLSANMISGHILIKILISAFINLPSFSVLILPIIFLELMVAFLQSYVFLVLVISYYGDISVPH